jgi:putative transposase
MCRSKNIRLSEISCIGQQHYFVTVCSFNRGKIFVDRNRGSRIFEELRGVCAARNFTVHAYCLMPDHLHVLAEGSDHTSDLLNLVKTFKLKTSRAYSRQTGLILWQRKFYDHILRPNESPESVAWYIWLNPVRKGLSATVQSYPFNGSFTSCIPRTDPPAVAWIPPWRKPAAL